MSEIEFPEDIHPREMFSHEVIEFQPWIETEEGLHRALEMPLGLSTLKLVSSQATTTDSKRPDLVVEDSEGYQHVVELFLDQADDSHNWRLLGYMANTGASSGVLLVTGISDFHLNTFCMLRKRGISVEVVIMKVKELKTCGKRWPEFSKVVFPADGMPSAGLQSAHTKTTRPVNEESVETVNEIANHARQIANVWAVDQDRGYVSVGSKINQVRSRSCLFWQKADKQLAACLNDSVLKTHFPQHTLPHDQNREHVEAFKTALEKRLNFKLKWRGGSWPKFFRDYDNLPTLQDQTLDALQICEALLKETGQKPDFDGESEAAAIWCKDA